MQAPADEGVRNAQKRAAARAARELLAHELPAGAVIGVGTGSTTAYFIDELPALGVAGAVASSERTRAQLAARGVRAIELNDVRELAVYVDGADEITEQLVMIKGGGGAATREKLVAAVARRFVCICDEQKLVRALGGAPVPIEVLPMARAYVERELARLGGEARLREGVLTDNGNVILDVRGLDLADPARLETTLDQLAGAVGNGVFARRPADVLLLGTPAGVRKIERPAA